MSTSPFIQAMQAQFTLGDVICLADIKSSLQLKELSGEGYDAGFTASQWIERFPSIPVKNVFCHKTVAVSGRLMYIDAQHYICLELPIFSGMLLTQESDEDFVMKLQKTVSQKIAKYNTKQYTALLAPFVDEKNSRQNRDVPLRILHQMIQREPASPELYDAFVYVYSICDCDMTQITLSDIKKVSEGKSKEQQAFTTSQLSSLPDTITIFRGEGNLSTSYEKACSWTLDPNVAFYFSYRHGSEAYKIYKGRVKKKNILEYINYRYEAEIVVFPEAVESIEKQEPCSLDDFLHIITADITGYELTSYSSLALNQMALDAYEICGPDDTGHNWKHGCRVAFFASYLYRIMYLIPQMDMPAERRKTSAFYYGKLMQAAVWYDADSIDAAYRVHASYAKYKATNGDDLVIQFLIENVATTDETAKAALDAITTKDTTNQKEYIWNALCILKDADALDRLRFTRDSSDFLDVKTLRFKKSLEIVSVAGTMQKVEM